MVDLTCLECNEDSLSPSLWEADFRHVEDQVHVAGLECYVCKLCGADPVFPDQIRRNQRRISDAMMAMHDSQQESRNAD